MSTATAAPRGDGGSARRSGGPDGGRLVDTAPSPPQAFDPNETLRADLPPLHELGSVVLSGAWRARKIPEPLDSPQTDRAAIEAMRRLAAGRWEIGLRPSGRMRVLFVSRALPLPPRSALLARFDRYGTLVLWPGGARYRILAPGALKSTLGEGRADISPLSPGRVTPKAAGERLGLPTRSVSLGSPYGRVELQLANLPEAGRAAPLLCRLLVEIVGIDPATPTCREPEVALAADFRWTNGPEDGGVRFEIDRISRRIETAIPRLAVPPTGARQADSGLPRAKSGLFFDESELGAFRTDAKAEPGPRDPEAPESGLEARNQSDLLLYLLVDGVAIEAVEPWADTAVAGLRSGRYSLQWRSFLGEVVGEVQQVELPAVVVYGAAEPAETPDAG